MLIRRFLIILSLCVPIFSLADELTLNKDAPKSYTVKKGDTLWDISGIFLNQPWLWPKLWRLNPDINNPHLIYPGDELRLVFDAKGEPMLVKGKTELKWSPKVRTQLKDLNPVSTLPFHVIEPFIHYDSVKTAEEIELLPYVIGSDEGYKSSVDGFKVYVNGELALGQGYAIYQKGTAIVDPQSQETLGYNVRLVGTGKAMRSGDVAAKKPATIYVDGAKREIRSGAFVVPVNEGQQYPSAFAMQAVDDDTHGLIISAVSGAREFGKLEVVMINRGQSEAVNAGDVFTIKRRSPGVVNTGNGPEYSDNTSRWNRMANASQSDYEMPEESIGKVMVFKVYDKVSMALILDAEKPLRILDIIAAPE